MARILSIPHRTMLLAAIALGLLLRLTAAVALDPSLSSDDKEYVELATTLVTQGTYTVDGVPTAYRPPGYPFFLASIFSTLGPSLLTIRLLQAVLDMLTCLLVYRIAVRQMSATYAIGATFLYAIFPLQILYSATILSETVFTFLFMASIAILSEREPSGPWLLAGGLLGGLAILFRPVALLIPVLFMFTPAMISAGRSARVRNIGLVIGGLLLVTMPWMIRNAMELGEPLITTNTGVNFWIGNHAGANGSFSYPEGNPLTRISDERERSSEGIRRGLQYWREDPLDAGRTMLQKFAHMFSIDYWLLLSHHGRADTDHGPRAVDSYRSIPAWSIILTHGPVILVCLLTAVSLSAVPPAGGRDWANLTAIIAGWIILHLIFFGSARYRVPLHPILAVTAVHGWTQLRSRISNRTPRRLILTGSIMILLLAGWTAELYLLLYG